MPSPERKKPSSSCGFRRKFLEQWHRFRRSAPNPPGNTNNDSRSQMLQDGERFGVCVSRIEHTTTTASLHSTSKAHEAPEKGISIDDTVLYHDHKCALPITLHTTDSKDSYSTEQATTLVDGVASDLWSRAYREAVESLGEDINVAIVKGKRLEQLFRELEEIDKEVSTKSAFLRGLEHLKAIQGPLGTLKQVLDVATPLASAEPTAATVFGVVSGVTTIAISLASADMEFAKKIGEMLEQLPCIDDCDTLGQKADNKNIHQALVLVYQKILEFYQASFDILTKKGVKLVAKIVLANSNLAGIIEDFLVCASNLRNLISVATSEVIQDMRDMLYDQEISRWLGSERATVQSQYYQSLKQHRADQACEFLLADARFDNWYRTTNQQQLVIVGDMGSGKSVLMTFLVEELKQRSERQLPQPKVCHYYCRADGTGTIVCILSTLILELLKQFPGLKKPFFNWYKEAEISGDFDPATNLHALEQFLQDILEAIDRPLFFVIDGLDECDRTSRYQLLNLLGVLSRKNSNLKVLLSSRPEENILQQLRETVKIVMGSDAERDAIIVHKTVESNLGYLTQDVKTLIIDRLSREAQGSAIWTKMIVELIEKRRISGLNPMRRFLDEMPLPNCLSTLYDTILLRYASDDPENLKLARTALKILAVARRTLSVSELAWAATLGSIQQDVRSVADLAELDWLLAYTN